MRLKYQNFNLNIYKAETNKLKMSDLQKTLRELQKADKLLKSSDISQKTIIFNLFKNIGINYLNLILLNKI